MRLRLSCTLLSCALASCTLILLMALSGCSNVAGSKTISSNNKRVYNGTASVGDFLNITIDPAAKTLSYTNLSNGTTGIVPYTTSGTGTYVLNDPTGNLVSAYEVPGYALLIEAQKTGPKKDTPALITAVESGQISMATFSNHSYNYMQFRTASGGLEVGSVTISATTAQNSSYWPYGALNPSENNTFHNSTLDFSGAQLDSSGTFLKNPDGGNSPGADYIFGTSGGFFIVDSPNGAIMGMQKADSAAFVPTNAGTYKGMFYQKLNAHTGLGNVETGTPSLTQATITITASGDITITDSAGNTVSQGTLTPLAEARYLYNGTASELQDPCNGLFTFRITTSSSQQDVFVTFVNGAVVFSAFSAQLPWTAGNDPYNYMYGIGLK